MITQDAKSYSPKKRSHIPLILTDRGTREGDKEREKEGKEKEKEMKEKEKEAKEKEKRKSSLGRMADKIKTNLGDQHANPPHTLPSSSPSPALSFSPASPLLSPAAAEQMEAKQSFADVFADQILLSFFKTYLGGLDDGRPLMLLEFVSAFDAFALQHPAVLHLPSPWEAVPTVTFAMDRPADDRPPLSQSLQSPPSHLSAPFPSHPSSPLLSPSPSPPSIPLSVSLSPTLAALSPSSSPASLSLNQSVSNLTSSISLSNTSSLSSMSTSSSSLLSSGAANELAQEKGRGREKEREKEKEKEKERGKERGKSKEKGREKTREKEKEGGKGRDKSKEKESEKDSDKDKEREKGKEKGRESSKDKEREKESESMQSALCEMRKTYKAYLVPTSDMMSASCLPPLVKMFCEELASLLLDPETKDLSLPPPAVRAAELLKEISGICMQVLEVVLWPTFLQSRYYVRYKARSSFIPGPPL